MQPYLNANKPGKCSLSFEYIATKNGYCWMVTNVCHIWSFETKWNVNVPWESLKWSQWNNLLLWLAQIKSMTSTYSMNTNILCGDYMPGIVLSSRDGTEPKWTLLALIRSTMYNFLWKEVCVIPNCGMGCVWGIMLGSQTWTLCSQLCRETKDLCHWAWSQLEEPPLNDVVTHSQHADGIPLLWPSSLLTKAVLTLTYKWKRSYLLGQIPRS